MTQMHLLMKCKELYLPLNGTEFSYLKKISWVTSSNVYIVVKRVAADQMHDTIRKFCFQYSAINRTDISHCSLINYCASLIIRGG